MAHLTGDISRETFERSPSEVNETTEDKGRIKLRLTPLDNVQLSLRGSTSSRDGTHYETVPGENPLLRKYNISDRDRVSGGLDVSYQPNDRLSPSANLEHSDDDYDDTEVGPTDAEQTTVMLDAAFEVSEELSGHACIGREYYESKQAGSQVPNSADWFVKNEDTVDSFGIGLRWKKDSRLEFGSDYVLSRSKGETDMQSGYALPPVNQFPDLESKLHSLRLLRITSCRRTPRSNSATVMRNTTRMTGPSTASIQPPFPRCWYWDRVTPTTVSTCLEYPW